MANTIYIELDKAFLDKNEAEARKEAKNVYGDDEEGKNKLVFPELIADMDVEELNDDGILLHCDTKLGNITFTIPMTTDLQTWLIDSTIKKLNKFKTLIEAVK